MSDEALYAYLIWSNEHGAWWRPDRQGYTTHLSAAGHYTRAEALDICARAIPGNTRRAGKLHELPVRRADVNAFVAMFDADFPRRVRPEAWE